MSTELDNNCLSKNLDPIDGQTSDFDWAEEFERLDSGEGIVAFDNHRAEIISRLMHLFLANAQGPRINPKAVGLRVLALAWVMNPANYPDAPSLRTLAERCGVSPAALAFFTGEVSRLTGIRNRAQRHAANWRPA